MKLLVFLSLLIIFTQIQSNELKHLDDFQLAHKYFLKTIRLANSGEMDKVRERFLDSFTIKTPRGESSLEEFIQELRKEDDTQFPNPIPPRNDENKNETGSQKVVVLHYSFQAGVESEFELEAIMDHGKNDIKFSSARVF